MAAVTDGETGSERQGHSEWGRGQDLNLAGLWSRLPRWLHLSLAEVSVQGKVCHQPWSPYPGGRRHCCGRPGTEGPNGGAAGLALAGGAGVGLMLKMWAGAAGSTQAGRHAGLGPGSWWKSEKGPNTHSIPPPAAPSPETSLLSDLPPLVQRALLQTSSSTGQVP